MRQFAVNNKAIPPQLNDAINRCHACTRAYERSGDPEAVCADHAAGLRRYAREIGAPSTIKRGAVRMHHTVRITEDAPSYDLGYLRDKQQKRIGGG